MRLRKGFHHDLHMFVGGGVRECWLVRPQELPNLMKTPQMIYEVRRVRGSHG